MVGGILPCCASPGEAHYFSLECSQVGNVKINSRNVELDVSKAPQLFSGQDSGMGDLSPYTTILYERRVSKQDSLFY